MTLSHGSAGDGPTYLRSHRDHVYHCRLTTGIIQCLQTEPRNLEMSPMKTSVFSALLVAMALVCAPRAAVLATEATVVQLRLHGTYEDTLPPENPFGPRLLHFCLLYT